MSPYSGVPTIAYGSNCLRPRSAELFNETLRRLLDRLMTDLIDTTRVNITDAAVSSVAAVRALPGPLAAHSDGATRELEDLQGFLFERLYRSPRVHGEMVRARGLLEELFESYRADPTLLPPRHQRRTEVVGVETAIADYVAGMTDRYVVREHQRLVAGDSIAARSATYG